jgi:hypothetical protein
MGAGGASMSTKKKAFFIQGVAGLFVTCLCLGCGEKNASASRETVRIEIEEYLYQYGADTGVCSDGGRSLNNVTNRNYALYDHPDFGSGSDSFSVRVNGTGGRVELKLDNDDGPVVGTVTIPDNGGWQTIPMAMRETPRGRRSLYLVFLGDSGQSCSLNWIDYVRHNLPSSAPVSVADSLRKNFSVPGPRSAPVVIPSGDCGAMQGVEIVAGNELRCDGTVGRLDEGSWLEYEITVDEAADYAVDYRTSATTSIGRLALEVDGDVVDRRIVFNTFGIENWATITGSAVPFTAGKHTLRVRSVAANWNLNWIRLNKLHFPPVSDRITATESPPASWAHQNAVQRLAVSANGRYLVTQDGIPFFWLGDTAWHLTWKLGREEIIQYVRTRAQQGYTVIAVNLSDRPDQTNVYGSVIFDQTITRPVTTPGNNPGDKKEYDYWDHVDFIVNTAAENGIYLAMVVLWGGSWVSRDKEKVTAAEAETYGEFIGQRYKDKSNVVYILGGDEGASSDLQRSIWNAVAKGIAVGTNGREEYRDYGRSQHPQDRLLGGLLRRRRSDVWPQGDLSFQGKLEKRPGLGSGSSGAVFAPALSVKTAPKPHGGPRPGRQRKRVGYRHVEQMVGVKQGLVPSRRRWKPCHGVHTGWS